MAPASPPESLDPGNDTGLANAARTAQGPPERAAAWMGIVALCRPAHLPTIVSNCLAGWWLGGGGNLDSIIIVLVGALLLFLGGAFLNDAFDVSFDRERRRTRPVPCRAVSLRTVWRSGLLLLILGTLVLQWPGRATAVLGLLLVLTIILHNSLHRLHAVSPIFFGSCRFFLYLIGASVAVGGVTGWAVWCGIAIALFTIGLELLGEASMPEEKSLGVLLLVIPAVLAGFMNTNRYITASWLFISVFAVWLTWSLRDIFGAQRTNELKYYDILPAMILADMLAACVTRTAPWAVTGDLLRLTLAFLSLFLTCVLAGCLDRWLKHRLSRALV